MADYDEVIKTPAEMAAEAEELGFFQNIGEALADEFNFKENPIKAAVNVGLAAATGGYSVAAQAVGAGMDQVDTGNKYVDGAVHLVGDGILAAQAPSGFATKKMAASAIEYGAEEILSPAEQAGAEPNAAQQQLADIQETQQQKMGRNLDMDTQLGNQSPK